jgi:hypothetical protein
MAKIGRQSTKRGGLSEFVMTGLSPEPDYLQGEQKCGSLRNQQPWTVMLLGSATQIHVKFAMLGPL